MMMSGRGGFDAVAVLAVRTFLAVLFVVGGREQALGNTNSNNNNDFGTGNSNYRAPRSCPAQPSYCNGTLPPWACKPKTMLCSINKPVCLSIAQNFSTNAVNLTSNVYYYNRDSTKCWQALNLTWTARPKDYDGFFVKMIYNNPIRNVSDHEDTTRLVIDKNKPGFGNGTKPMLFYYDCQRLAIASSYRFELYGLHDSSASRCLLRGLIGVVTLATNCDTYPEADNRISKWIPFINVVRSDRNSTIRIYFTPAPQSFRFSSYHVLLLDSGTKRLLGNVSGLSFTCTRYHAVVFNQVCSGNYTIQIYAFGDSSRRCRDCSIKDTFSVTGSEYSCLGDDVLLESSSTVNSTLPTHSSTLPTHSSTLPTHSSTLPTYSSTLPTHSSTLPTHSSTLPTLNSMNSSSGDIEKKTKIVVLIVVFLALLIGVAVVVVMLPRICKDVKGMSGKKPSVLLIYAKDNEYHCNVVQRFASYLQQRCHCEVKFDLWCPDEISKISALDWLMLQIQSAGNIIIVNSEGGWRQYEGSTTRDVTFERIRSETPLQDMFLPAMKELRRSKRVFKVAFPYTHSRYFIGDAVHSGRTYALMNDIEDLFLGVQQLSKHSVHGKKLAFDINASDYTKCKEGRYLAAAVKEAGEFLHAKPEWFSEFYFQKDPSPDDDCQRSPAFDSGIGPSAEYMNSTSDQYEMQFDDKTPYEMQFDDETPGFTFYPPSDLSDNASSVSGSNIEELFAVVNSEYDNTMTN